MGLLVLSRSSSFSFSPLFYRGAHYMPTYEDVFRTIDINGDGQLSLDEFTTFCEALPKAPTASVIARLFLQADVDNSGFVDASEFGALCEGVKLLVNMSEEEMVDAYAMSELRRLFQLSTQGHPGASGGTTLRRDELRKVVDMLNEALELGLHNDGVASALRGETASDEYDFFAFHRVLCKIAPKLPLTAIVTSLKEEEQKRRARLVKVKSVFELRKGGLASSAAAANNAGADGAAGSGGPPKPCAKCDDYRAQNELFLQELSLAKQQLQTLKAEVDDKNQELAIVTVDTQRRIKALQSELLEQSLANRQAQEELARKQVVAAQKENLLRSSEGELQELRKIADEKLELDRVSESLAAEVQQLRVEVSQANDRASRAVEDMDQAVADMARMKRVVAEREADMGRLQGVMETTTLTSQQETERVQSLFAELRRRCEERESAAREFEEANRIFKIRLEERERHITAREDAVTSRERSAMKLEHEMNERWESAFQRAAEIQESTAAELLESRSSLKQEAAQLAVREQLFEQKMQRAETASLPERERRLRMLQDIERELCGREQALRKSEAAYVEKLITPELQRLRDENQQLKTQVMTLREVARTVVAPQSTHGTAMSSSRGGTTSSNGGGRYPAASAGGAGDEGASPPPFAGVLASQLRPTEALAAMKPPPLAPPESANVEIRRARRQGATAWSPARARLGSELEVPDDLKSSLLSPSFRAL